MKFLQNSFIQFIRRSKKTILLIVIVSATTLLVSTLVSIWLSNFHNLRFPSLGTIRVIGVEAYRGDINTTQDGKQYIDWGTVYPGTLINRSFYINNSGSNTPVTLSLSLMNLTFFNSKGKNVTDSLPADIQNPLTLTWNYSNTPINPLEEIYVILTLEASSNSSFLEYLITYEVERFNFEIAIRTVW